jgi:hypothetical protein
MVPPYFSFLRRLALDSGFARRLALGVAVLLIAAAPKSKPVELRSEPGTARDRLARQLAASDIRDSLRHGDRPLVLVGSARLSSKDRGSKDQGGKDQGGKDQAPALFVQLQAPRLCGSAGCSTTVYIPTRNGWKKVLDDVTGKILVDAAQHGGMHDLIVHGHERYVWNGQTYRGTLPVKRLPPSVKLPAPAARVGE